MAQPTWIPDIKKVDGFRLALIRHNGLAMRYNEASESEKPSILEEIRVLHSTIKDRIVFLNKVIDGVGV